MENNYLNISFLNMCDIFKINTKNKHGDRGRSIHARFEMG